MLLELVLLLTLSGQALVVILSQRSEGLLLLLLLLLVKRAINFLGKKRQCLDPKSGVLKAKEDSKSDVETSESSGESPVTIVIMSATGKNAIKKLECIDDDEVTAVATQLCAPLALCCRSRPFEWSWLISSTGVHWSTFLAMSTLPIYASATTTLRSALQWG